MLFLQLPFTNEFCFAEVQLLKLETFYNFLWLVVQNLIYGMPINIALVLRIFSILYMIFIKIN